MKPFVTVSGGKDQKCGRRSEVHDVTDILSAMFDMFDVRLAITPVVETEEQRNQCACDYNAVA